MLKRPTKDRLVRIVRGLHAPALEPRRGRNARQPSARRPCRSACRCPPRQPSPVSESQSGYIERCEQSTPASKTSLQLPALAVQVLVIEEDQLREEHRLLAPLLALSATTDGEHRLRRHLGKTVAPEPEGHGDKRIVAAAGRHGVELVFPALEALVEVVFQVFDRLFLASRLVAVLLRGTSYLSWLRAAYFDRILSASGTVKPPYCWLAALGTMSPMTSNATSSVFGSLYQRLPSQKPPSSTAATSKRQQFIVSRRADMSCVDIAVAARLQFLDREEEFLIQLAC